MVKKLSAFILCMIILVAIFALPASAASGEAEMEDASDASLQSWVGEPVLPDGRLTEETKENLKVFFETQAGKLDKAELQNRIAECDKGENNAHQMAEYARSLDYSEDNYIICQATNKWWRYRIEKRACNARLNQILAEEEAARKAAEEKEKEAKFQEDLYWLSKIIWREVGTCPDWVQQYAASVVINRVNSKHYADTIYDVIFEDGQYGPAISGSIYSANPDARCIANCEYILKNGSILPRQVMGQNGGGGDVYAVYYNPTGWDVYFTYVYVD